MDVLRDRADLVILRSVQNPNLRLDVRGATINGGELAQLHTCHDGNNQACRLPPPSPTAATYGGLDTEGSGFHAAREALAQGWSGRRIAASTSAISRGAGLIHSSPCSVTR